MSTSSFLFNRPELGPTSTNDYYNEMINPTNTSTIRWPAGSTAVTRGSPIKSGGVVMSAYAVKRARVSYACTRVLASHLLHIRSLRTDGSLAVLAGASSPGSRSSLAIRNAHTTVCTHVSRQTCDITRGQLSHTHTHTYERTNKPLPRVHTVVLTTDSSPQRPSIP